jgi:hypothetical protein
VDQTSTSCSKLIGKSIIIKKGLNSGHAPKTKTITKSISRKTKLAAYIIRLK